MKAGVIRIIDRITAKVYSDLEEKIWREDLENSPHGQPWHTSFHASSFPGDDPIACGRKAIYGLMNVPRSAPTSRFLRAVADSGKAIEDELVKRWAKQGYLLSADINEEFQTGFVDEEYWLTGNCDAAILPRHWTRPHIVEVKSKAHDKVLAMKNLERGPDKKHRLQVLTYIGLAHEQHPWRQVWRCKHSGKLLLQSGNLKAKCTEHGDKCGVFINLEPCLDGTIFYVSRDDPSTTHEFTYTYDPEFMASGRDRLASWQHAFRSRTLPDRPRHPDGKLVGWSEEPCKYCDLKKDLCKKDYQLNIEDLSHSNGLVRAKEIWPDYDLDATAQEVLDRWKDE